MDPLIINRVDAVELFDVQVNGVPLFINFTFEDSIIAYWALLFVGQFKFPKGGEAICYLIQRYLLGHKDYASKLFLFLSIADDIDTFCHF